MVLCAYHASHEQLAPSALVRYVRRQSEPASWVLPRRHTSRPGAYARDRGASPGPGCNRTALGVSQINRHNVNREQEAFIDAFGGRVLPALQHA
jgi:hypothetical protein